MNVIALVPLSERDARRDGALLPFRGEPLLSHAVRGLVHSGSVDRVVVTGPPHNLNACRAALAARVTVLAGGASRTDSVRLALPACSVRPSDVVVVHDPLRPFVPAAVVAAVVGAVREGAASVVPVEPVTDTIKIVGENDTITGTRHRDGLRRVQSPFGYRADVLTALVESADGDDLDSVPTPGSGVHTVAGHPHGMSVRTPFDVAVLEALLDAEGAS